MNRAKTTLEISTCTDDCLCYPNDHDHIEHDCPCNQCFWGGYSCDCGHDTCLAPRCDGYDFENLAVAFYRYCMHLAAQHMPMNLNPVEWFVAEQEDAGPFAPFLTEIIVCQYCGKMERHEIKDERGICDDCAESLDQSD